MTAPVGTRSPDDLVMAIFATPEGRRDPFPLYRALRETAPVHLSALAPLWYLTRYADCREVLVDPAFGKHPPDAPDLFSIDGGPSRRRRDERPASILFLNPPDHTRIRGLMSRVFTPRRVEALRPRIVALLEPLLDRMEAAGEVDVMEALAFRLPISVIGELVGVPAADRDDFRGLVRDATATLEASSTDEDLDRAERAVETMREYFSDLAEERRRRPTDDLLSAMVTVEDGGETLSEEELLANTITLFGAGFETTTNLIGNGLWELLGHPDQLARLRADRSLVPGAIEEILRYQSPVQVDARYAFSDHEIDGHRIGAGETVVTFLGAANRDPAVYDDPETFDIERRFDTPLLSFGWGIHHCLGSHLARAEGQEVLGGLIDRFDRIELLDDEPAWRPGLTLRGLESLRVRVTAR